MKPLARCMAVLTIGDTTHNTTAMYVYLLNHFTNVGVRFAVTTNGSGLLTVDLTDYPQIEGHDYELWATLATATNPDDREIITIGLVEYECFSINFIDILEDGALVTGENQTLEAV